MTDTNLALTLTADGKDPIPRKGPPITIVNNRPKIGRNKRVSIEGAPPVKHKRTPVARLPIPHTKVVMK